MQIGLFQKQSMKLVMTNELRQAINLLQYSTIELSAFIEEEFMENPLVELEEGYEPEFIQSTFRQRGGERVNPLDLIHHKDKGLWNDVLEQIKFSHIEKKEQTIMNYLALNLNDNGYLMCTNTELAKKLEVDEKTIEDCIEMLQGLDPVGIGARDLTECLLLQAQAYYPNDIKIKKIIKNHLEDLAAKKWNVITRSLNITLKEMQKIVDRIQTLNPKPCSKMTNDTEEARYLYPDILVKKTRKVILFISMITISPKLI